MARSGKSWERSGSARGTVFTGTTRSGRQAYLHAENRALAVVVLAIHHGTAMLRIPKHNDSELYLCLRVLVRWYITPGSSATTTVRSPLIA